ncbi:MAG: LLM class F420-dependent oxidoreductase [SAR202 cluster bacterium]|jgi:probable F420-dependent oxidoreductase|nr:LLM class F420-dependent oxidoreductase [SAR202 cluster bacterium]MDP6513256.1 LLM class F420-dependent oxidoreductase [SAR202 cluster bacterium]MDP6714997.1 LLM class F420-dependent oxidoreductase [SAR202 cluster bacterium]
MEFGFTIPKNTDGDGLRRFAGAVEDLGFGSVWVADHIVLPSEETDQYPYTEDGRFTAQADDPQLDVFVTLSYIASATTRIKVGTTVVIVPYRNPIVQAKMFTTLDTLTNGRVICGVGVGWWKEEFDALGASHADRGPVTDEYLQIFRILWNEESPEFHGQFYDFEGIKFAPKPVQSPSIPIWVGGHTRRAARRVVKYGDAWHPTRQTPEHVVAMVEYMKGYATEQGRDYDEIGISLKRSLHFTDIGFGESAGIRSKAAVIGSTQDVIDDVKACADLGFDQLNFDFRSKDVDECIRTMERFAEKVVPQV